MRRLPQRAYGRCFARRACDAIGAGRREHGFTLAELLVTCAIIGLVMGATLTVHLTGSTVANVGESKAEAQQGARSAMIMEEDVRMAGYGYPSLWPQPPAAPQPKITAASATSVTFIADLVNASTTLSQVANTGATTLNVVNGSAIAAGDTVYLINGDQAESLTVQSTTATTVKITTAVVNANGYPVGTQLGRPRTITYSWNAGANRLSKDSGDGTGPQPFADGVQAFQLQYFDTNDVLIPAASLAASLGTIRRIAISMSAQSTVSLAGGAFTVNSSVRPRNL